MDSNNSCLRGDGRHCSELRAVAFERQINRYAEGSSLIRWGNTLVHCTASVEEKVPPFLRGSGSGWVSAEYAMLPRATHQRTQRESSRGRLNARGSEIQRLIGRALRAAVALDELGERTIWIDCDVLQADGGTRTASITAAFVALTDALRALYRDKRLQVIPLREQVAAVSVGKVEGVCLLDLCYEEDKQAEVDANFVMVSSGNIVEIQATGEQGTFSKSELNTLMEFAWGGIRHLHQLQWDCLDLTDEEATLIADRIGKR